MKDSATQAPELLKFAAQINVSISNVFAGLRNLEVAVGGLWPERPGAVQVLDSNELAVLQQDVLRLLAVKDVRLHGAGIVFAPGQVRDREMHLEWWCRGAEGDIRPLNLNFNRLSERFYDYESMPWYVQARHSGKPCVAGPFVDLYGTEEYIVAFSVPIFVRERFIGVAAADVCLESLEPLLIKGLMKMKNEALVLNAEGRVLAANTVSWSAGDLVALNEESLAANSCRLGLEANPFWTVVERAIPRSESLAF